MKEDYQFRIMSTRLRVLEKSVVKIQEKMKRLKREEPNSADILIRYPDKSVIPSKHLKLVDISGNVSTLSSPLVSFKNGFDTIKPSQTTFGSNNELKSESLTPVWLIDSKHNWLYGVLFVLVNVVSVLISCFYIRNAYNTWQSSPVVQALSNSQVHFENISFPAVTICFPNSFKEDYDYFGNIEKCLGLQNISCTYPEMVTLALANLMCPKYSSDDPLMKSLYDKVPAAVDGGEFDTYMEKLFPPCEYDVVTMQLSYTRETRRNYTRCDSHMFQQFYSYNHNRLCMTYNSLPHDDIFQENVMTAKVMERKRNNITNLNTPWTFDTMMHFNGGLDTVPVYGLEEFIIVIHKQQSEVENICTHLSKEIASVILHSPNEIPLDFDGEIEFLIRKNVKYVKMFDLLVMPKISLARDDLAQYPPRQRGCLFAHERTLSMFKFYTKKNCELECIVDLYLTTCGCVPYFYPRQNASVKVCLQPCPRPKYRCDCLPDCNHLTYDMVTREVPVAHSDDSNSTPRACIQVMLRGKKFYTTIRYSITSFAEFLAYSLGVLGVFLGFSVTCLWRLLYFGAYRLWSAVRSLCHKAVSPVTRVKD